jgi:predicted metal-dependent peptidase
MTQKVTYPYGEFTLEQLQVTPQHWETLAVAIYKTCVDRFDMRFFGHMLQNISITFSTTTKTAKIQFIPNEKNFRITINPAFWMFLDENERGGILLHEIGHMTGNHLTRNVGFQNQQLFNIAADATINQVTPGIPSRSPIRGIFVEDYKLPKDKTVQYYYDNWPPDSLPQTSDDHDWDPNVDEADILDATEDVIQRTMIKMNLSHDKLPGSVRTLLDDIQSRRSVLSWSRILKSFVKRNASGVTKEYTSSRPSRHYGYRSPGKKPGSAPKLLILIDTSLSQSAEEINIALDEVNAATKVGTRTVKLGLWHTSLYDTMKYSRNFRAEAMSRVHGGGTCFEDCAKYINKVKPDAVIVFTDGVFNDTTTRVQAPILFILSSDGTKVPPTTYSQQKYIKMPSKYKV